MRIFYFNIYSSIYYLYIFYILDQFEYAIIYIHF